MASCIESGCPALQSPVAAQFALIQRMTEAAATKGADAILTMRLDTSEIGKVWSEICAYGTAVKIRKV
jgi:uncharacterized protein YbjQ (UPF0145 family)